jgi:hypothetical protein
MIKNGCWIITHGSTILPGQGGPPNTQVEQIKMINWIAGVKGTSPGLSAQAMHGTTDDLLELPRHDDKLVIVTIQKQKGKPWTGHAMVLAAYDPGNARLGIDASWGFLDPAGPAYSPNLRWMTDAEFQEKWSNWATLWRFDVSFALGGSHNMVVVSTP